MLLCDTKPNFLLECEHLFEDQPRRDHDPGVMEWLSAALARTDAGSLYVHGSNMVFDHFKQPNTEHGQLIFGSKLVSSSRPHQAEYYGENLYLIRMNFKRMFSPHNDPRAREIMSTALGGEYRWEWSEDGESRTYSGVFDFEKKMEYGRIDYQDLHLIVPLAVAAGYDFFRVYECSMRDYSFATSDASIVEIVDHYPK